MKTKKSVAIMASILALVLSVTLFIPAFIPETKAAEETPVYTLNAQLNTELPGVYMTKAKVGDSNTGDNPATIGILSVAKQTLADHATKESPAIITGAAVNYETKTGPTEFTPIPGAQLVAPYSYFRWKVMDQQMTDADGNTTTVKKLSGFDGSYYIIRVDVSDIIKGKEGYLHVRQDDNKALMVAMGFEGTTYSNALGSKTGSYSLADNAAALKDTTGNDKETPYFDVILMSSGKLVAGADQGSSTAPSADVKLSFYVDDQVQYNDLQALDPTKTYTWPQTFDGVEYIDEPTYNNALLDKFFDKTKATAENNASSYVVKGSDLEIDVTVEGADVVGEKPDFWSLTKAIAYHPYDSHTVKLISEVPVLEALTVDGPAEGEMRKVSLDVNSFDIQIANNTKENTAGISVAQNATLEIKDGTQTAGAELAIGNNATMVIEEGGVLMVDESCTAEVEYDAATTTGGETEPTTPLTNGEVVIKDGGRLINFGVINIEGKEAKPLQPNQQEQQGGETVKTDMRGASMIIQPQGDLENYGSANIKGTLYVLGTLNNYVRYDDVITKKDPDKGNKDYHKGLVVSWKDDVTQEGAEHGKICVGIDSAGTIYKDATVTNYGDIVLAPGTIENHGTIVNSPADDGLTEGHIYLNDATEAVIPITPTAEAPTVVEKRVTLEKPQPSVFNNAEGAVFDNKGIIGKADVEVISNGVLGKLTPLFQFDDVNDLVNQWFYKPVYTAYEYKNEKGTRLMSGYESGEGEPKLFGPTNELLRAEFAVMMHRLANEPEAAFDAKAFPDVTDGQYFTTACMWAKNEGVITGYDNGTFGIADPITREQVATILYRYAKYTLKLDVSEAEGKGDVSKFSDAASVSQFAQAAMIWANGAGIVTGNEDGTIAPQGHALRAHAAAMFQRFIDYVNALQPKK